MTDDNLNELKRNYSDLVNKMQELLKLRETLKKYEEKHEVKEYLALKEKIFSLSNSIVNESDDTLLEIAMTKSKTLDNLDNIYVYLGSYKASNEADIEHPSRDTRVFHGNNDEIDYKKYRNLEGACFDDVIVPSDKCDEFEDENIIIYPRTNLFGKYYYKVRNDFYKDALEDGIDKAKKKLLSREKTNYNRINKNKKK